MGSREGDGDGEPTTVTMEDLKNLETRLSSSLVNEVKKMLEQLLKDKDGSSPPSPQEELPSAPKGNTPVSPEGMVVGDKLDNTNSSTRLDGGKGEHRDSWYSPDPPIPHPHVYNRGDPPKLEPPKLEESATFA